MTQSIEKSSSSSKHTAAHISVSENFDLTASPEPVVENISKVLFGLEEQTRKTLKLINVYQNLPGIIREPLILNYWGSTGTGKSELVNQIVKNLGLQDRFYSINFANSSTRKWDSLIKKIETDLSGSVMKKDPPVGSKQINDHCKPVVLFFDEFQHARVLDERYSEIQRDEISEIWQIMDEGVEIITGHPVPTIIFVAGNIGLSSYENIENWEGMPDEERESIHIPMSEIQRALSKRFRSEMVARLRNNHFVFAPIDKFYALKIIDRELGLFRKALIEQTPVEEVSFAGDFSEFMIGLIEAKGMGARGIESTVNAKVKGEVNTCFIQSVELGYSIQEIHSLHFRGLGDEIIVTVGTSNGDKFDVHYSAVSKTDKLKFPDADQLSVFSVHEAGHALATYILNGTAPKQISVGNASEMRKGFVLSQSKRGFYSEQTMINDIAVYLSGLLAEKIIFGHTNATTGAAADLEYAQNAATAYVLYLGLGENLQKKVISTDFFDSPFPDINNNDREEMKYVFNQARRLSEYLIKSQLTALITVAMKVFFYGDLNESEFESIMEKKLNREKLIFFFENTEEIRLGDIGINDENFDEMKYVNRLRYPVPEINSEKSEPVESLSLKQILNMGMFNYTRALFDNDEKLARKYVLQGTRRAEDQPEVLTQFIERIENNPADQYAVPNHKKEPCLILNGV